MGPCLLVIWKRDRRILKRYELVLLTVVAISIPVTMADWYAMKWGAWEYNPANTVNIHFPAELESYFFSLAVSATIASCTLVLARQVDLKSNKRAKKRSNTRNSARRVATPKPFLRSNSR